MRIKINEILTLEVEVEVRHHCDYNSPCVERGIEEDKEEITHNYSCCHCGEGIEIITRKPNEPTN